jgi:hypothetical protein
MCFVLFVVERLTLLSQDHFLIIFLLILSSIIFKNNYSTLWIINFDKMRPRYPRVHIYACGTSQSKKVCKIVPL